MYLYLMQHGEAMAQNEHPERPLTDRGKLDVENVAAFLARAGVHIDAIRHSGKRRVAETANLVAPYVHAQEAVTAISGLNPNDAVEPLADQLRHETLVLMLVGHLPFLSRLTSYLLCGDLAHTLVQFQTGGVVCLEQQEDAWIVRWMVVPELLRK